MCWQPLKKKNLTPKQGRGTGEARPIKAMSGRLVILSKKKWNVWNQDCREKVLRDERLHEEGLQAAVDKERALLQEKNLETLRGEGGYGGSEAGVYESKQPDEPFRLFADLESKAAEALTNEDYMKEKKLKEQLAKKREGIAE